MLDGGVPMDVSLTPRKDVSDPDMDMTLTPREATGEAVPAPRPFPTPFEGNPDPDAWEANQRGGTAAVKAKYLKELELCQMLAELREKPEWWLKVNQPIIVNRWKREMYNQATLLTPQTIEYGIQELKYHSQLYQQSAVRGHSILPSAIDGVVQNDQLISDELLLQLRECLKPFEEVPESERDYHPGSDHQVIDLVHPSLYCLRIGQTKLTKEPIPLKDTLRSIGSGEVVSEPPTHKGNSYATSKEYAWLPSEFEVAPVGSRVNIASYINNVHPIQHATLYQVLADIFVPFIPMFEKVLTDLQSKPSSRMGDNRYYWRKEPKVDANEVAAFQAHLVQERKALKVASNGQAKFYLDVVKKDSFGLALAQVQATDLVCKQVHPKLELDRSGQSGMLQFQDRLARLYLESTFEAYTKTEGLLTTAHSITSATNFNQPPFLDFYGPASIRDQLPELLKHSRSETLKAVGKLVNDPVGGLVFKEKVARRWFVLFKRRLPKLYPQISPATIEQYCQLLLMKEFSNLIRLCAAIEYFTAEILELGGNCAQYNFSKQVIEARDIRLSIDGDAELLELDDYLNKLYVPPVGTDERSLEEEEEEDEVNEDEIAAEMAKMVDGTTSATAAATGEENKMEEDEEEDEDEVEEYHPTIHQPEVNFPFTPQTRAPQSTFSLAGRTLQVIVKLANIELTPEKPNYPGGAWHVEGMRNESIVASGIYYINSTNITESRLSFRAGVQYWEPEQDDSEGPRQVHGLYRDGDLNQPLGTVITKTGRALAFPNIYQHRVQPFQLADPTLPGKRQILVFFLVDPTLRVISTANVPPQQQHWLKTATGENMPTVLAEMNAGTPLIPDLVNLTAEYHSDLGVIDQPEAFRVREKLMKERKYFVDQNTEAVYKRHFSFCEH